MNKPCILTAIVLLAVVTTEGFCAPVLISVELLTMESKKAWHQLKIPTYELIGNTAIAVAEESRIGSIKQKGYSIEIIDRQPELTRYVVLSDAEKTSAIKGTPIWQNDKTAIIQSLSKGLNLGPDFKHNIRPMNTRPLRERFWKSNITKYVTLKSIPYDPFIQGLVDQVNADSITSYIQRLQDFRTRYSFTDSNLIASAWIYQKLSEWGYSATLDTLAEDSIEINDHPLVGMLMNPMGKKTGTVWNTKNIICSGHFDSPAISPLYGSGDTALYYTCPGANDNASGTAGMMEAARIFKNNVWVYNNLFIGFNSEELGFWGSKHYASWADSNNIDIKAVINMDMIGAEYLSLVTCEAWIVSEQYSWLNALYMLTGSTYIPTLTITTTEGIGSDHYSFDLYGYPAMTAIQPNDARVHTVKDSLTHLSPELLLAIVKNTVAIMAVLNMEPGIVENIKVYDIGNGTSTHICWDPIITSDIDGYKIFWGRESGNYTDSVFIPGVTSLCDTIENLIADTAYYIIIRAVSTNGYQSVAATETMFTPRSVPLTPIGLTATPVNSGITLVWKKNLELDLAGYDVYCRIDSGSFDSLTHTPDTFLLEKPLVGSGRYYYRIQAKDIDGNKSVLSDSVYCRPITLDQGILIVDETNNWTTGSFPRDAQQDSFYNYIMADYKYEQYEYGSSAQKPILADLSPYSTVAWLADDYTTFLASGATEGIETYLDNGGKMWFAGWKPSSNVGSSLFDKFKIYTSELSGTIDSFKTATGLEGYPDLAVDTLKYPASTLWGKTMRYIEALTPLAGADTIYVMDMKNTGSPYEGRACAVRDSGKTVFFGFPLYFMDREQAKLAAQKVMQEFGEPYTGVEGRPGDRERITGIRLYQNVPNPFRESTNINYLLTKSSQVSIKVYNVAGQLVKTLVEGIQSAGDHAIKWDGRDDNGLKVSNGVYVYKLEAGGIKSTKKMLLLR